MRVDGTTIRYHIMRKHLTFLFLGSFYFVSNEHTTFRCALCVNSFCGIKHVFWKYLSGNLIRAMEEGATENNRKKFVIMKSVWCCVFFFLEWKSNIAKHHVNTFTFKLLQFFYVWSFIVQPTIIYRKYYGL